MQLLKIQDIQTDMRSKDFPESEIHKAEVCRGANLIYH